MTVAHVSVRYGGVRAVEDASFTVRRGTLHGIIGPNGAGKTTLLNAVTGLVALSAGTISLGSVELRGRNGVPRRRLAELGVSRTFQTPLVVPELSSIDNVMLGLHTKLNAGLVAGALQTRTARTELAAAREECAAMLTSLGVDTDLDAPASTQGFGNLRRIELARSLVTGPRLLILDEPTSGLEVDDAHTTVELLRRLQHEEFGGALTILLVEHNVPLVFGLCDQVTAMHEGGVLITGDPATVREDPAVRESYLATTAADATVGRTPRESWDEADV
jgi:ABC-type branched-subunit amino acid transport system ATPase component